ncbi:ATP-dependent DNA helicase Pif1 [Bdellovibrio bacteriovorus]|uniref:ATP-dependent DNA helicase Pif1 n=1 Tax=Bdellovibrio bacteriovorus (strain ATCC 15356 / DSM 50701 / NCIMB 9529 / HD100) TaxID=264462 RepID=PIF1_BDEBA|nr:ATP-dependent DNA helicase Pif1 [Bdellovibrio bacteriovorus]Q6MHJ5.1 RecName: Full=ATP-dependent DNA helicase pif1 [Bdellovibrio bacteriovorus HD100]CAE78337.1 RRM3/PIF1 helicase homolog [Bdellovibrio bacteriovorus HD100]
MNSESKCYRFYICFARLGSGMIAGLMPVHEIELSPEQASALDLLRSGENVFLTGGAGSGKSFLIRQFMRELDPKEMPILASTGAAAVLLGGRTFHSFFGLGIMEGGADATYERASKDKRLMSRLRKVEGVIIDEISMIPGQALMIAEALSQRARESKLPWGGMRVIAVGDFAQLPPVTHTGQRDWCFLNGVWEVSGFQTVMLSHNQRVSDNLFLDVLSDVRHGKVTERVREFLNEHVQDHDEDDPGTRLFPRKINAEKFNERKLAEIDETEVVIESIYSGSERHIETLKKASPIAEKLILKIGCQVMFLQNDPQRRWVNGTRGTVVDITADQITVRKDRGREVQVSKSSFAIQDAEGNIMAQVEQFPLTLAYATTIHKSQGATLDDLWCDLSQLWEPGQAYVALSRLRSAKGLHLIGWNPRSIIVDPKVLHFYKQFEGL